MWKDVPGFEGLYRVSDTGEIKSLSRWIKHGRFGKRLLPEIILKPYGKTYPLVMLRRNGQFCPRYIHRLVAEAFLENPTHMLVVNHKDGNKKNNNVSNLEWVSYSENNYHALNTGLNRNRGSSHYQSRLTKTQVIEIKRRGKFATYKQIGKQYGVSASTIRDILVGNTYKNI